MNLQGALLEAEGQKSHSVTITIRARMNCEDQTDQHLARPREEMRDWLESGLVGGGGVLLE